MPSFAACLGYSTIELYLGLVALYFPDQLPGSSSHTEKLATSIRHA